MRLHRVCNAVNTGEDLGLLQDYNLFFTNFPKTCEVCDRPTKLQCGCKSGYYLCSTACQKASRASHKSDCQNLMQYYLGVNLNIPNITLAMGAMCSMMCATGKDLETAKKHTMILYHENKNLRVDAIAWVIFSCVHSVHTHTDTKQYVMPDAYVKSMFHKSIKTIAKHGAEKFENQTLLSMSDNMLACLPASNVSVHEVCRILLHKKDIGFRNNPELILSRFNSDCVYCGAVAVRQCGCNTGYFMCAACSMKNHKIHKRDCVRFKKLYFLVDVQVPFVLMFIAAAYAFVSDTAAPEHVICKFNELCKSRADSDSQEFLADIHRLYDLYAAYNTSHLDETVAIKFGLCLEWHSRNALRMQ